MRRAARVLAVVVFSFAGFPARAADKKVPAAKTVSGAAVIEGVSVQTSGKFTKVVIQSSQPLSVRDIAAPDGKSVSLYMTSPTACKRSPIERGQGDLLDEIRYGYQGAKTPMGEPLPLDYISLRFKEPASYSVSQREWILQVELRPRGASITAPSPVNGEDPVPQPRPGKGVSVLPASPGLSDVLQVGLANHVPLRLAEEEYGLAKWRHLEAGRALLPSASGRVENAQGTLLKDPDDPLDDIHFRRKEVGVQWGQPVFHSGRLYYAFRQAAAQKRVAAQNVRKARADLVFEVTRAYHNLLKSQRTLAVRRQLMDRMDKVVELARKKRQLELITEEEALGTESQYAQAHYRLLSDEKDLEVSRLRLEALLGLPEPLPSSLPDGELALDHKSLLELNGPVDSFVDLAFKSRPEMLAAEQTARAESYGEKVAKAEGRLLVDASGFVGRAGGAFDEEESLKLRKSWNVGMQASLFFLGNSIKGSKTKDHTQPDYGETTATNTRGESASVGFLDGLKGIGDRRQARIARERAHYERDKTRRDVEVDVREAYFNIQKSRIQIKAARQEMDYRQKALGISRQKERMNLVEPSQAMSAESSYADAVSNYEEAVSFYKVSLGSLEKALGVPLESIPELK
jgi:outer membrane protein TolC